MNPNPRLTKQGLRDLNNYGPKLIPATVGAAKEATEGDAKVVPPVSEKGPDAVVPVA
jgi:hypothetical protein